MASVDDPPHANATASGGAGRCLCLHWPTYACWANTPSRVHTIGIPPDGTGEGRMFAFLRVSTQLTNTLLNVIAFK